MASLLDMAQARLQGLLDLPARAGRALVDPTVFSGLLGAPTLPKERGIAQAAYGLPPEPNMSVLNPEQAAYIQGYALHRVEPRVWQEPLGLGGRKSCATGPEWKRKLKTKAQELYPHLDVTLGNADALLILHYATGGHR